MSERKSELMIEIVEIQGHCAVYRVGSRFTYRKGTNSSRIGRFVCTLWVRYVRTHVPLSRGIAPADLVLAGSDGAAYVECLDPQHYAGGGTVKFCVS